MEALRAKGLDHRPAHALQPDGSRLEDGRDGVGRGNDVAVTEDEEGPLRRIRDQADGRRQDRRAGPLRPDERGCDVEAPLWQEAVQGVARDDPGDAWEAQPDLVRHPDAKGVEAPVQLAAGPALRHDPGKLVLLGPPDPQSQALVGQHLQRLHVVRGAAGHQRMDAARVVAQHPAQRASIVGRRVRTEREAMPPGGGPQVVEDDAGFHGRGPRLRVEPEDPGHVTGAVEDHGDVARLACQARTSAAKRDRRVVLAADRDGGLEVVAVERSHDADGDLPVVRGVGGVEGAFPGVEADLASDVPTKIVVQCIPGSRQAAGRGADAVLRDHLAIQGTGCSSR